MAYENIDLETLQPNGKTGEPLPTALARVRRMFKELYASWTSSSQALAKLTPAANKLPYFTGAEGAALADFTDTGRKLSGAADQNAAISALGGTSLGKSLFQASSTAAGRSSLEISDFASRPLIGTVSVASGVVTGAVIERGSNSNGSYVRFADGTQICRKSFSDIPISEQTSFGGWTYRSPRQDWTYPAVFSSVPAVAGSERSADVDCKIGNLASVGGAEFRLYYSSSLTGRSAVLEAIGRWYE